jgi:prepilin-type N-terminal cleavage/methylation domain-containing protein/prepilin-type processing-associated H-X9-DG protein
MSHPVLTPSRSTVPSRSLRHGFTLIELLVVIAIIAILTAILFPVFASAREKARQTACLSNLKQIGLAAMQYAQDYDEGLPAWDANFVPGGPALASDPHYLYWQAQLQPYIKSGNPTGLDSPEDNTGVWQCPDLGSKSEESIFPGTSRHSYSYGYNGMIAYTNYGSFAGAPGTDVLGARFYRWPTLTAMGSPASTIYVGECGYAGRIAPPFLYETEGKRAANQTFYSWEVPDRHNGGANYIFADGHAKWLKSDVAYPPKSAGVKAAYKAVADYFAYTDQERDIYTADAQ